MEAKRTGKRTKIAAAVLIGASWALVFAFSFSRPLMAASPESYTSSAGTTVPAPAPEQAGSYDGSRTNSGSTMPNQSPTEVEMPEQSALYERANENLALQSVYLLNRIGTLTALANAPDSDERDKALRSETGHFCDGKSKDDLTFCAKQFIETHVTELERIKTALVRNQDSIAELRTNLYDSNGKRIRGSDQPVAVTAQAPGTQLTLPKPSVPRYAEFSQESVGGPTPPQEDSAWVLDMTRAPDADDHPMTASVGDVDKGSEVVLQKIVKNDKGEEVADTAALAAEKTKYAYEGKEDPKHPSRYKYRNAHSGTKDWMIAGLKARAEAMKTPQKLAVVATKSMKEDYLNARRILVENFNKEPKKRTPEKAMNYPSGLASLAGGAQPQHREPSRAPTDEDLKKWDKMEIKPPKTQPDGTTQYESLYLNEQDLQGWIDQAIAGIDPPDVPAATSDVK